MQEVVKYIPSWIYEIGILVIVPLGVVYVTYKYMKGAYND